MSYRKLKTCVIFYFHDLDTDFEQNEDHDGGFFEGKMDVHIVAGERYYEATEYERVDASGLQRRAE